MADWICTNPGHYTLSLGPCTLYLVQQEDPQRWLLTCHELGIERDAVTGADAAMAQDVAIEWAWNRARPIARALESVGHGSECKACVGGGKGAKHV